MKKILKLTESELVHLIDLIITEASHSEKFLPEIFKYIKKNMDCQVVEIKNGYKICPPLNISTECYTTHRSDKGAFDLLRFLADKFGLSKHYLEMGIRNNVDYERIKQKSREKNYIPKEWK